MSRMHYFVPRLTGYRKQGASELGKNLEQQGFTFSQPGLGGGGEMIQQVIAYISVNDFWMGVFSSIAANQIERILRKLYEWHKKNRLEKNKLPPVVNIYFYSGIIRKKTCFLSFRIDKIYSHEAVLRRIREAKKN